MRFPAQLVQHLTCFLFVGRFSKHFLSDDDHRIGSDEQFVFGQCRQIGIRLFPGDETRHLLHGKRRRIVLVNVWKDAHFEVYVNAFQQFAPTR